MGKLRVLPAQIANMIAAGEVVQRPSSVVKELMENAVDAGATSVDVIVTDAGRTLIQVIDNGCGMSPAEAVLCFERHATSKISDAADLTHILTYGFRGEALASIAAVAEVTLKTRRESDETAVCVRIGDGGEVKTSSVAAPQGSNFAVRNLFYNTPARRKFLKSDSVELRHIIEEFSRVALTRPEIAFSLTGNGRELHVLKKAKSLKFRVMDLLGSNVVSDIVDVNTDTSVIRINGFVGRPDAARKTAGNQYFFINGRSFRSGYLHKAVMKAYEDLIPDGYTPAYFLFLEADPQTVDVNIHPAKTEIKFEDESMVFQTLYASVRQVLGTNSFGAGIDFSAEAAVALPSIGSSLEQYRGGLSMPSIDLNPDYDPFADPVSVQGSGSGADGPVYGWDYGIPKREAYGRLFEDNVQLSARMIVFQGKYILVPVASGLMAVNVARARERILYERSLAALGEEGHVTQTALFPVQVEVGVRQMPLFEGNAGLLAGLGFDIKISGTDKVVVEGVPEGYSCEPGKVQEMVSDLIYVLSEEPAGSLGEMMRQRMAGKFAILGASHAEPVRTPREAQALLDVLYSTNNPELTPGGRRIVCIIPTEEFDKKF